LVVSGHGCGKKPDGLDLDQACRVFAGSSVFALTGQQLRLLLSLQAPTGLPRVVALFCARRASSEKIQNSGDEIALAPAKPPGRNQARMEERRKVIEEYVSSLRKMLERLLKRPH
jgi:hypothetical protein